MSCDSSEGDDLRLENLRERHKAALQQSALARSSEPGSVVVKATPKVWTRLPCDFSAAYACYRRSHVAEHCIPEHVREIERNWQKVEARVSLKLENRSQWVDTGYLRPSFMLV